MSNNSDIQIEYDQVCYEISNLPNLRIFASMPAHSVNRISIIWAGINPVLHPDTLEKKASESQQILHALTVREAFISAIACGDLSTLVAWETDENINGWYSYKVEFPSLPDEDKLDTRKTMLKTEQVIQWAEKVKLPTYKQILLQRKLEIEDEIGSEKIDRQNRQNEPQILLPSYETTAMALLKVHVDQNLSGLLEDERPTPAEQKKWLESQAESKGLGRREWEAIYTVARPEEVKKRATGNKPVQAKIKEK